MQGSHMFCFSNMGKPKTQTESVHLSYTPAQDFHQYPNTLGQTLYSLTDTPSLGLKRNTIVLLIFVRQKNKISFTRKYVSQVLKTKMAEIKKKTLNILLAVIIYWIHSTRSYCQKYISGIVPIRIPVSEILPILQKMPISALTIDFPILVNTFCCLVAAGIQPTTSPEQSIFFHYYKS